MYVCICRIVNAVQLFSAYTRPFKMHPKIYIRVNKRQENKNQFGLHMIEIDFEGFKKKTISLHDNQIHFDE